MILVSVFVLGAPRQNIWVGQICGDLWCTCHSIWIGHKQKSLMCVIFYQEW